MPSFHAADGEKLSYWDIGRGPACVMMHGFGMPAFLWLPFIVPLANRYRFILPDQRGFGGSHRAPVRKEPVFTQYAHDLHELLTHLKLDKPALVGFSMGACTSMEYQRLYGFDAFSAYLQIDQALHVGHTEQGQHGLFGEDHSNWMHVMTGLMDDMRSHGTHNPFDRIPKPARQRLWNMFAAFSGTAFHHPIMRSVTRLAKHERLIRTVAPTSNWPIYLACMSGFVNHRPDFRQSMSTVPASTPVWFFVGEQSRMYPADGQQQAAQTVKHARVVNFRDAGHAVMFDSPVRFVKKLDEFLAYSVRRRRRAKLAHNAASAVISPEAMAV